jgi:hypothetical protein
MLMLPSSSAVGAAQDRDIEPDRLEAQPVLSVDRHQLDQLVPGGRVLAPAAMARIDEGVQSGARDETRTAAGDVAHQLRHHALRQDVGLDLVGERELGQHGRVHQRAGDAAAKQALVAETRRALSSAGRRSPPHGSGSGRAASRR